MRISYLIQKKALESYNNNINMNIFCGGHRQSCHLNNMFSFHKFLFLNFALFLVPGGLQSFQIATFQMGNTDYIVSG